MYQKVKYQQEKGFRSVNLYFATLVGMNKPQDLKNLGAFLVACPPVLRVSRRGKSTSQVVSLFPNRPLAKRITPPATYDKNRLAKINPNAEQSKVSKVPGISFVNRDLLYTFLCS